jgi:hypothetical protein
MDNGIKVKAQQLSQSPGNRLQYLHDSENSPLFCSRSIKVKVTFRTQEKL